MTYAYKCAKCGKADLLVGNLCPKCHWEAQHPGLDYMY